jgi:septum formation protein
MSLVLASASRARRLILEAAGLELAVDPAALDEGQVKARAQREGVTAGQCAVMLAEAKAAQVAGRHPGALVIGADQMLDCQGTWLDKPRDPADARRQLTLLRGRAHTLHAAIAVACEGDILWRHLEPARLVMRRFSDGFLDDYLAEMGEEVCGSVGGYLLEGLGAQLFQSVEGDYFSILGLPLLPLLAFLRDRGAIAS